MSAEMQRGSDRQACYVVQFQPNAHKNCERSFADCKPNQDNLTTITTAAMV